MFEDQIPSKEDLILLKNISTQNENMIEDLYKIFSYHRPKDYKIYVSNLKYNPLNKNKIYLDLITTIEKYNKLFTKQKDLFKDISQNNRLFYKLYKNNKYFGKSATSKKSGELLNNILPKYEQKHMIFNDKFLKKNIFHKSGLLPYTLKQNVDFFNEEIKQHGINSSNSLKYINFIEKLYTIIQNTLDRKTINNIMSIYENKEEKIFQLRQERILKANLEKAKRKEIKIEKKEIKKLKKLIDIANVTYEKIMESIYNSKDRNKKSKSKSKSINKDNEINKVKKNENYIRLIKSVKTEISEEKESNNKYKCSSRNTNKQSASLFSDLSNNTNFTNNTTSINNRLTTSTAYGETKNNFYNIHSDLLNRLNNIKIKKAKEKEKEQLIFKPLPIKKRTLSRNKINISLLPLVSQKTINEQDNNIKIKTNIKMLKSYSSAPLILNFDSNKEKNKKKKSKKSIKGENIDITKEQRKKVPLVYEQLKKIKNVLYLKKMDLAQSSKTYELLHKIYSKNKILNVNPKEVPKELYNYYYNMRNAIERKTTSNFDFKKYKKLLDVKTERNLQISQEQDDKLKTKYLDLVHTLIKKKLTDEDEE